jgi:hypothetical protein
MLTRACRRLRCGCGTVPCGWQSRKVCDKGEGECRSRDTRHAINECHARSLNRPAGCHPDHSTEKTAWQDFARTACEYNEANRETKASEWNRRFPLGRDRAEHYVLHGGYACSGKVLSATRSAPSAVVWLHDADELFVQVPQECRPPRR